MTKMMTVRYEADDSLHSAIRFMGGSLLTYVTDEIFQLVVQREVYISLEEW